jgi:hypothetical protein
MFNLEKLKYIRKYFYNRILLFYTIMRSFGQSSFIIKFALILLAN